MWLKIGLILIGVLLVAAFTGFVIITRKLAIDTVTHPIEDHPATLRADVRLAVRLAVSSLSLGHPLAVFHEMAHAEPTPQARRSLKVAQVSHLTGRLVMRDRLRHELSERESAEPWSLLGPLPPRKRLGERLHFLLASVEFTNCLF